MDTWHIEYENGSCSMVYDTLEQAKAALAGDRSARMSPRRSKPVRFVSSEGEKIEITGGELPL
jgi:hypothetical protein